MPTAERETSCVVVRDGARAIVLDAGGGLQRLVADADLRSELTSLDIVLTHFHLDHVCGLSFVPALALPTTIWAPGRWLYETASAELLDPLRRSPLSAFAPADLGTIRELEPGQQRIGDFEVLARAQLNHWDPTAGLRIGDSLALITDTAYDTGSATFASGVCHLLHEAWSSSAAPVSSEGDATGREAGIVARDSGAHRLTLVHLNPQMADHGDILDDARAVFPRAELGHDGMTLTL